VPIKDFPIFKIFENANASVSVPEEKGGGNKISNKSESNKIERN
jgi:hypothetical protein